MAQVEWIKIFFCQFQWLHNYFLKNSTHQVRKDSTAVQTPPVFFKWPIHNGSSEAYLICYIPSHTLPRWVGKNSESALIMTFWKMVHFWFYGQKIVFSVPRALQDVLFQNYIHSTVLRILLNVTKFFKHGVGSKKPIFPCVSSGQWDYIISDSRNPEKKLRLFPSRYMVSAIKHYERHGQTCCNSDFRFLGQQICPVHFNRDFPFSRTCLQLVYY